MSNVLSKHVGRWSALAMVTMAAALAAGCGDKGDAAKEGADAPKGSASAASAPKPALSVSVVRPVPSDWVSTVAAHGSIAAWQEAVVGAELSGLRLVSVNVNVGDVVRRGQVLATLNAESVQADLASAKAGLGEATAVLAEARSNAERARKLRQSNAVSAQEEQAALTAEQTAQARVEAARARLSTDELRLSQTRVVAPDDGIISARLATVGSVVPAGQELFRLIRQQRLEWRGEVPASDLARIKPGMLVQVLPTGGSEVQGRVRMVAPTVDTATRNGLVYVDLPVMAAAAAGARAGGFAAGRFDIGRSQGLALPQSAVLQRDGFSYVFKLDAQNKVVQLKVQVGRRVGDRIEITQGLDAQSVVVASGVGFLADGDTVRVVPQAPVKGQS